MSWIRAKISKMGPSSHDYGFTVPEVNFEAEPDIHANLDDEMLKFVLALIRWIDDLGEGEALTVWKQIW